MLTRDQRFAESAYTRVQQFAAGNAPGAKQQYMGMAQEFPVLVRTAGLLQALAFIERSSADADRRFADDLARTVGEADRNALLARCRAAPLPDYMRLTEQALAACAWYKRVAQVLLEPALQGQAALAQPEQAGG